MRWWWSWLVLSVLLLGLGCSAPSMMFGEGPDDPDVPSSPKETNGEPKQDQAPALPKPAVPPLDVAALAPGKWAWFGFEKTKCRDGSEAGMAVSVSPTKSKKVMFFFEGGGACFDRLTCAVNPANVKNKEGVGGVFDRSQADNPFADYTHVFIPYCTGDVHAGNNPDAEVAGDKQQYVGYTNSEYFLQKVAATFPDTERLVVTGISAGGFGAAANFGQALRIFPTIPVHLVDDSGQVMREPTLAQCLQEKWKTVWRFDKTIIKECGETCANQADYLQAALKQWASKSKHSMGLISATADSTIRFFFGFGSNGCGFPFSVSKGDFETGLQDIKAQMAPHKQFGTFLYPGTNHTVMQDEQFYTTTAGGQSIAKWVRGLIETDAATNVGP